MGDYARTEIYDILASRKAEDSAWRRFQAAAWLESLLGPIGISSSPSEREFISRLRNGLVLCNAINKVQPGAVPKVVENHIPQQTLTRDFQPLPAYQYFENVRNFLVAVEELKIPAFEASDLERDTLESGSVAKVVDCILALKLYHESKQMNGGTGCYKPTRSPMVPRSASRINSQPISSESCRRLDMSAASEKQLPMDIDTKKLEDLIIKILADRVADTKENINDNILTSFSIGNMDPVKLFLKVMSNSVEEKFQKLPELQSVFKDLLKENDCSPAISSTTTPPKEDFSELGDSKCCQTCSTKGSCNHKHVFEMQEKELLDLKALLIETKSEFQELQSQLQRDFGEIGIQVQEMSSDALGYHRVLEENRNLYNMVQDLKGNIRVYCRIRPAFSTKTCNVIDYVGKDGSLVILDPLKPQKEGRKVFQFNHVFGSTATQEDVFKDTKPLIRSVMDGYNVCIFAYGQTGSGKTYTMSGPSGGSTKDLGINYLALNYLFEMSNGRKDIISYDIQVQMVEIYNEQVRDLLAEDSSATKLDIRSCPGEDGLSLPDATMYPVKSTVDVINLMKLGEVNRVVSATALNSQSSRSHSVLTVHVHGKDTSGSTIRSCLHLVDLAGSERVDKSEVTGDRLKEALYINKSLSCLGDVITALAQKSSYIPYRNSKLTLLLQDSLGGHAKTLMFAHVSPESDSFGETVSTLKFAQRVSTVELGAARANKESTEVMQLKEEVENLRKTLASKESQNSAFSRMKEPKSMADRTPPRFRRLSIEGDSNIKSEKKVIPEDRKGMNRTPPRLRRLSIEGNSNIKSEKKVIPEDRKGMNRTPPRLRRLSIEGNSNITSEKKLIPEDRKGIKTPSVSTRSRRLSLEGPKAGKKDNSQGKPADDVRKPLHFETLPKCDEYQDAEAVSKPYGSSMYGNPVMQVHHHLNAPQSPPSYSYHKRMVKTDSRTPLMHLQLPTTPQQVVSRNEVQSLLPNELALPTDSQTTKVSSGNGKGSQIRKSFRNIGKLIHGSEKRTQQNPKEARSPICGTGNNNDIKSPLTADANRLRRQSLTGVQGSRRSSLGGNLGKPIVDFDDSRRNARTPPPVHPSMNTEKRWV